MTIVFAALSVWALYSAGVVIRVLGAPLVEQRAPQFDSARTRLCPNDDCRLAVVDSPVTRCPSCWTQLPATA